MLSYWIDGSGYSQILVDIHNNKNTPVVDQYYVNFGKVVKHSKVRYVLGYNQGIVLDKIVTDDTDTVVLPKGLFEAVSPHAVQGGVFRRLVVPLNMRVHFMEESLIGSDALCDFLSLSRNVTYEKGAFPSTIVRRRF